jgi:hypothetical protein
MNAIIQFLCTVSGTRKDALSAAPQARQQAATIGVVMLITATIACVTMTYAIQRAFVGDTYAMAIAYVGGILWGSFVLAVDRQLLIGIDKLGSSTKLFWQAVPRLAFAVCIGLAVSKPVVLRIAQTVLDREIHDEKRSALKLEKSDNAKIERLDDKLSVAERLHADYSAQEGRLHAEPDSYAYTAARDEVRSAEADYRETTTVNGRRIASARRQIAAFAGSERQEDYTRANQLRASIGRWDSEIARAKVSAAAARERLQAVRREWQRTEEAKLAEVGTDLKKASADAAATAAHVEAANNDTEAALGSLLRTNLVNEYTTLKRIEANPSHPDSRTLRTFEFALDILFILIEITPLLSKLLSRPGPLDHATAAAEFEDRERINLAANTHIAVLQKQADISLELHDRALQLWRDSLLSRLQQTRHVSSKAFQQIRDEISRLAA